MAVLTETTTDIKKQHNSQIETLQETEKQAATKAFFTDDETQLIWTKWLEAVMGIAATGINENGKWSVTGVDIALARGGPECHATWQCGSEFVEVVTTWGGVCETDELWLPFLAKELQMFAENI